jgi:hypothetical protein
MKAADPKDLIVLVADKNMDFAVRGILGRPTALGIRGLAADVHVHPERDPGCFRRGPDFLRPFGGQYRYALAILDHEGSGQEHRLTPVEMEQDLEHRLAGTGWKGRSAAIVIAPALDVWVWSDSPHVDEILGWGGKTPALREWLSQQGRWQVGAMKPQEPKMAIDAAMRVVGKSRTSDVYGELAGKVSFGRCTDPAFVKLKAILGKWFGH